MKPKSRTPPAPLEAHLGFWLRFVSNHVSTRFQQQLEAKGVTVTEWVALRTLWAETQSSHAELIRALGMTKGAAQELGPFGVRVNSVHPGIIDTPMMAEASPEGNLLDRVVRGIPMGHVAQADDVARLVLYLASDESGYSTGSEFVVDGGMTA